MLLDVQDVSLTLNDQLILSHLNLQITEGDIHSLLGVNGVGKSTLATLLMGLRGLRPNQGRVLFDGKDITQASITERAHRGLTLAWQSPASFEGLTVEDYLTLSSPNVGNGGEIRTNLRMVGLAPGRYLSRFVDDSLSGGERRRIELAAVVCMCPRLAILDEPDSGIDFISLDEITDAIRYLSLRGTAVLLITHREEMALIANHASLMCAGTVVACGEPHAVTDYFRRHCDVCKQPNLPNLLRIAHELH